MTIINRQPMGRSASNTSQEVLNDLLLQRFRHWATQQISDDTQQASKPSVDDLLKVVSTLLQQQAQGQGIVLIKDLFHHHEEDTSIDIEQLAKDFPHLIGTSQGSKAPIVIFPPFIAFRRDYQLLAESANFLTRSQSISIPSPQAFEKVTWHLGDDEQGDKKHMNHEQRLAAITASSLPFCSITGGAGTGKTTTLAKALELILLDNPNKTILLAAPTGKAAQRLNESLAKQISHAHHSVRETLLKLKARTLHQLLGISAESGMPFFNRKNPLRCDVLAVDEASMVGSHLFSQIQQAILPQTQLILLGDANQLPPINSTAFFNDVSRLPITYSEEFCQSINPYLEQALTPTTDNANQLNNAICRLNVSQRFAQKSVIEQAGEAILAEDNQKLLKVLGERLKPLSSNTNARQSQQLVSSILSNYPENAEELDNCLNERIILCANRQGNFGSYGINQLLDKIFRKRLSESQPHSQSPWYEGRRILIEQNDYQLNITNGDIGACRKIDQQWWIVFDEKRKISVDDLIEEKYSLAFAISIHKSQGSEYKAVDIVLDNFSAEQPNPIVTKALLYTAITRAKQEFSIYADKDLIVHALKQGESKVLPLRYLI